jgi:hypothetical protein
MEPYKLFEKRVGEIGGCRGQVMAKLRQLVLEADPDITEEWKWDTLVWSHQGLVCAVGAFKDNVGLNFFQGAHIPDPKKLFNAGLEAKSSRSVRFFEGDKIDEPSLIVLVSSAVAFNESK